ncbi:hypothetical protein BC937DRAFT_93535 [Endogone sp. FLAS-F59071]|nr:hypothetical protein BC937DRAFT_93535 [Endogone sp. FLAS-F59071]|eukprot:RUS14628.1 hypothetical protein BC937DRAFT_93535 [Endogone sp. FLAS-F59071]
MAKGIDLEYVQALGKLLLTNGFENVKEDYISIPVGWGGRVGELQAENARLINLAIGPLVMPILNVNDEQYQKIVDNLIEHYRVRKVWHKALYYFGWKPLK